MGQTPWNNDVEILCLCVPKEFSSYDIKNTNKEISTLRDGCMGGWGVWEPKKALKRNRNRDVTLMLYGTTV